MVAPAVLVRPGVGTGGVASASTEGGEAAGQLAASALMLLRRLGLSGAVQVSHSRNSTTVSPSKTASMNWQGGGGGGFAALHFCSSLGRSSSPELAHQAQLQMRRVQPDPKPPGNSLPKKLPPTRPGKLKLV